jgi:preprotein translocase subunit SecD
LVLVVVLGIVLVAVLAVGTVLLLRADESGDGKSGAPAAAAEAVQFRPVLKAEPGGCSASTSPSADGTACGPDGVRYTLGKVELDGTHVSEVKKPILRDGSGWTVGLTLDAEGAQTFSRLTSELSKKAAPQNQIAIVVRGRVVTAPAVMSPITGGELEISSKYTQKEAEQLAKEITG